MPTERDPLADRLAEAGFVAAPEEATLLREFADGDERLLDWVVERRLTGEPLAWIVRHTTFCGHRIGIDPGVYVPRWQSEQLAERAVRCLPAGGIAVDICTGAGAIATTLGKARPGARVVATEVDPVAAECARTNGVEVFEGDLFEPLPESLHASVDVVVGVVPYVPTPELATLQRDTFAFETELPYDGGPDGTNILRRAIAGAARFLRPGGALLLELGGHQADLLAGDLAAHGFGPATALTDEDGDLRGIEASLR
jgi:release factor glutamine methyltransferase